MSLIATRMMNRFATTNNLFCGRKTKVLYFQPTIKACYVKVDNSEVIIFLNANVC
jgi:hypothetical protein